MLTAGYRNSMTEIVRIIGRATRDCEGKEHAQFTNLIAEPDAEAEDVRHAVNNLIKAITLSLLMREVLAPNVVFRPRSAMTEGEKPGENEIIIEDREKPLSPRIKEILESGGIGQIMEALLTKPDRIQAAILNPEEAREVTEIEVPKIIIEQYPMLTHEEVDQLQEITREYMAVQSLGGIKTAKGGNGQINQFLQIGDRLVNVEDLNLDLVESVNPFQGVFEILSRDLTPEVLRSIQDAAISRDSKVSAEEAVILWPDVEKFAREQGREPSPTSMDNYERRLAEVLAFVRVKKAEWMAGADK